MRRLILALSLLFACGGDSVDTPEPDTGEFTLDWGPVAIPPGQEGTKCIWLRLSNETEIKVNRLHNTLASSSHHLIVYKDDMDTVEQTTPIDCQPFTGALNTAGNIAPIMITQRADDELVLPDGVAYTLGPHQMIKLEMHYLNSTDAEVMASAKVRFIAEDPTTITDEANILFIGSPDIDIAPGATQTLHQFFTFPSNLDLSTSKVFAITGHTHHLGTDVKVRVAPSRTGPMDTVYAPTPFSWSEPETTRHEPGFAVPQNGGFDFECTHVNTTNQQVGFGESANDEMCFFWAYYYPSQGSRVCVHSQQAGGADGIDICCPGDGLCALIEDQF
jgi:hypothetical protein